MITMSLYNSVFSRLFSTGKLFLVTAVLFLVACGESAPDSDSAAQAGAAQGASTAAAVQEESGAESAQESEEELIARARGIHERVITLDTHVDINTANFSDDTNYTMTLDTQVTLPKMEAGGLDVAWFIVYTGQGPLTEEGYAAAHANAIDKFDAIHRLAEEIAPDRIELAYTSADVRRIAATGKKVAMIGIENAYPVGLDLANIEDFYNRGGRYMSLAHNGHSQFADSQTGEPDNDYLHGGLSELGRQAVAEMNRLGIMVDISHPSIDAISQMLDITVAPVIASHSSARALTDHTRNLNDDLLLRVKENGGVVQTVAFGSYINEDRRQFLANERQEIMERMARERGFEILSSEEVDALSETEQEAYRQNMQRIFPEVNMMAPRATVSDFVDHIDYLVELIGIDHVGISSDFDGGGGVTGWNDASETFNVTLEMVRRGYSEEEIAQIWSGNLLRVLDEVQAVAAELQAGA